MKKDIKDLPLETKLLLDAILGLIRQYMPSEPGVKDALENNIYPHMNMGAGEAAVDALMHYGVGDDDGWSIHIDEEKENEICDAVAGKSFVGLKK